MDLITKSGAGKKLLLIALLGVLSISQVCAQQNNDDGIRSIERSKRDNTPKNIMFSTGLPYSEAAAQDVFHKYLGLKGNDNKMVFGQATTTKNKITTYRYFQWYKGLKVANGTYTMTTKENLINFITGNFYKISGDLSTTPVLSEGDAFNKALDFVGADKYMWQDAKAEAFIKAKYHKADTSYFPHGQLVFIEDFITASGASDGKLHLAYCFDVYAKTPLSRAYIYVDAATGKILLNNSIIKNVAASGATLYSGVVGFQSGYLGASSYVLFDSTRGNGVHTQNLNNGADFSTITDFLSPTNTWPSSTADTAAIDAHWAAEKVYDYWDSVQGRHSWDDAYGELDQYVHFDVDYDNAFWDGAEMIYGDGSGLALGGFSPLVSLDVTAHEIGHGVCQATAALIYAGESGGMNEGFSDCWGATIENWANPHEVDAVPKETWKIGEEIGGGIPLRSMDSPKLQGQPDTYLGINWFVITPPCDDLSDECGVHTNSGVLNHWYYLVCHGGSGTNDLGNSFSVAGIGLSEGANILYQTELILASDADYADCRTATIAATTILYGACSPEMMAVTNAWYGVGVGIAFVPCAPQIGYSNISQNIDENAGVNSCSASKTVMIPIKAIGPAITGGSPSVTITSVGGTAVAGVDYTIGTTSITFAPGDTTTHFVSLTINDNGAIGDDKDIILGFTLSAAGTTAIASPTNLQDHIYIRNDDNTPLTGGVAYHQVDDSNVLSNITTAFWSSKKKAHSQFLISPIELTAAGIVPNIPLSQIAFRVAEKHSFVPYVNYTVSMGNTGITNLSSDFITTGLTMVYSGDFSTTLGWDSLDFSTPFVWDGTSYVVVDVCFTNTAAATTNDKVAGFTSTSIITAYANANTGTGTGCSLPYNPDQTNTAKPIMRFKQVIPPTHVETAPTSSRVWNVKAGQEVYFYTPLADTSIIAGLKGASTDLGCVTATLKAEGTGFTPFSFDASVNRSVKEFSITPATAASTATYNATLYFNNTELGTTAAAGLYIFKTDAATDAGINSGNSAIVTPTIITGENYTGFSGDFTGFSRYFLVDGLVPLAVSSTAGSSDNIRVDNNPFHDKINVSYTFTTDVNATVKLYDVTGRILYNDIKQLSSGAHKFTIDCTQFDVAPGSYILQVITPDNVYTHKLIKN